MLKMHKEEIIATAAFLFLVILTGLFYFNDYSNITGAATTDTGKRNLVFGTYSIKPSFKANVNYDLEDYAKIKELTGSIIECNKLSGDILSCISQAQIKDNSFDWALGCDKGAEKALYDFAEFYQNCIDSNDLNCICTKNLEIPKEKIQEYELNSQYDMALKEDALNKKIEIRMTKPVDLSYLIDTKGTTGWFPSKYLLGYTNDYRLHGLNLIFTDELAGDTYGLGPTKDITIYRYQKDGLKFADFVRQDGDNLVYPKSTRSIKKPEGLHECKIKNKNTYKFCVAKKDSKIMAYDKSDNTIKQRHIVYQFAITIPSLPPKPIENLEVKDALKAENSVILIWNNSQETDINSYSIYYSTNDFINKKIEDIKKDEHIKKISVTNEKPENIDDINLEKCEPLTFPCRYLLYNKPIEKNKLYYWNSKNKFIYILADTEDEKEYNFAITAVNEEAEIDNDKEKAGNIYVLTLGKNYKKFTPVDDLAPSKVEGLINLPDIKTKLIWNKPLKNVDGTDSRDVTSFNIYYIQSTSELIPQLEIGHKIKQITAKDAKCDLLSLICEFDIENILSLEKGKIYKFSITALDEKLNELKTPSDKVSMIIS